MMDAVPLVKPWTVGIREARVLRVPRMKFNLLTVFLGVVLLGVGCATSTVEKRRVERADVYGQLSEAHRDLVDKGDITAGMTEDAVYIAWGKADQVLRRGDKTGESTRWLYEGTTADTHFYWIAESVTLADGRRILDRRLVPRTEFRDYVAAELVFREGKLESWEMMARPPSRSVQGGRGLGF